MQMLCRWQRATGEVQLWENGDETGGRARADRWLQAAEDRQGRGDLGFLGSLFFTTLRKMEKGFAVRACEATPHAPRRPGTTKAKQQRAGGDRGG